MVKYTAVAKIEVENSEFDDGIRTEEFEKKKKKKTEELETTPKDSFVGETDIRVAYAESL